MKKYLFPKGYEKVSEDFKVSAYGENIEVYSCVVSAYPLNQVWEGHQRSLTQTEKAAFVMLGSDGEVTLEISAQKHFDKVTVRPLSRGIIPAVSGKTARITFPGAGQYSVEFDDAHNTLTVFINPEKGFDIDKDSDEVLYFPPGVHIAENRIELQDNQTVFIDEGAVLYSSIYAVDKKNVKIIGYGILDNSKMERANDVNGCSVLDNNAKPNTGNPIFLNRCENIVIDGITIVDSSGWNIYVDGCSDIMVNNIKLIGQWRYNADGCDFCNCTNAAIKNSYLRTFDDSIAIKGFRLNNHLPCDNILAENCVLWCDWGRALEIGAETCAPYIRNITFKNCDVIHGSIGMLDIQHGDNSTISDVVFDDIRIEYTGDEMVPVIRGGYDNTYPCYGEKHVPAPIVITSGVTMWSIDDKAGNVRDVYFKNIKIFTHDGSVPHGSYLIPREEQSTFEGIHFENITVNGKQCDLVSLGVEIGEGVKVYE